MARARSIVGVVALVVGMAAALGPFISVWRVGGVMLAELPVLGGVEHHDQRVGWRAMFDDEFVLARRTYAGTTVDAVTDALAANGFENRSAIGFTRACCGDYDAVVAAVEPTVEVHGPDAVTVELAAVDADWRVSWPLFSGPGSLIALVGVGLLVTGRASQRPTSTSATPDPRARLIV